MDAPLLRLAIVLISVFACTGAKVRTPNFVVTAPTEEIAQQVGRAAESYRRDLSVFWVGRALPKWSRPCELRVRPGALAAAGETKFQFVRGEVLNWNMFVQGTLERILDSVLPHEINHTIFACHFRRPLPRWADEGAATLFEHHSEQKKQIRLLESVVNRKSEFIPLTKLLTMKQYPREYRAMLIMYAEGFALADFLVQQGGEKKYLQFLADGEKIGWPEAIRKNYAHGGVTVLERNWRGWIQAGMPRLTDPQQDLMVARREVSGNVAAALGRPAILQNANLKETVRLQSPDDSNRAATAKRQPRSEGNPKPVSRRRLDENFFQSTAAETHQEPVRTRTSTSTRRDSAASDSKGNGFSFGQATLEAPAPRVSPATRKASRQRASSPVTPSLGSRTNSGDKRKLTDFRNTSVQRKHLPQERTAVTGSIPQWAGFPGQKELF